MKTLIIVIPVLLSLTSAAPAFAVTRLAKTGDLTATKFDELGFDPAGLVGYWQLNGNAVDSSGQGNNGVNTGATAATDRFGTAGKAMYFDGGNNYININNGPNMGTSDFTICVWAQLGDSTYQWQRLFGKKAAAAANAGYSIYYGGDTRKFMWSTANGTAANEYWTINTFPGNDWYHIVMVRNNADEKKGYFYINAVRQEISAVPQILNTDTASLASIGALPSGGGLRFKGSIDEVKVFNRALTAAEILAMYNHEKGKLSVGKSGTIKALEFIEDNNLPVQMRSKKKNLTIKGVLIE